MVKKVENKKEKDKFDRSDHTYRDEWLSKVVKELKNLDVREVRTSKKGEYEPQLLYKGRVLIQFAHSKIAHFTAYMFQPGKRQIVKVMDEDTSLLVYGWLVDEMKKLDYLEETKDEEKPKKKPKSEEIKNTESIEDLEKRVENLSPKSNAIHIKNVTDEVLSWAESSKYKFINDGHTLLVKS